MSSPTRALSRPWTIHTSAKEDISIEEAFQCIARNALKNEQVEDVYVPESINMKGTATNNTASCC